MVIQKKIFPLGVILLVYLGIPLHAQQIASLDSAIHAGAKDIEDALEVGTVALVLNFNSPTGRGSTYVLEEMRTYLTSGRKLTVVDRERLDDIRRETNFQMSGDVSDESAQRIGRMLGAQSIVSGSLEDLGATYRIRFRIISVETASIQVMSYSVRKDRLTDSLWPGEVKPDPLSPWAYGAMNLAFGLGSYLQGDIAGGILVTAGYTVATSLIIIDAAVLNRGDPLAGVSGPIGIGLAAVTTVFGIAKPYFYSRSSYHAVLFSGPTVRLVSEEGRGHGLRFEYSVRF